jgi:ABC-type lipoprotein export system ATPase subunit
MASHRSQYTAPPVVSLAGVNVQTHSRYQEARLDNVSLTARHGDIVFIMGAKSTGKTALLEVIG